LSRLLLVAIPVSLPKVARCPPPGGEVDEAVRELRGVLAESVCAVNAVAGDGVAFMTIYSGRDGSDTNRLWVSGGRKRPKFEHAGGI
jgi:hypothetical protein